MSTDLSTAITDFYLFLFCLAAAYIIRRTPAEDAYRARLWQWLFLSSGFAALFGYFYHGFYTGRLVEELWWLPLYPLLFEATRCNCRLAMYARFGKLRPGKTGRRWLFISEGVLCTVSMILRFFIGDYSLAPCLLFAMVMAALCLYHYGVLLKKRDPEAMCVFGGIIAGIAGAAALVFFRGTIRFIWELDHNGVCHVLFFAALALYLWGALLSVRRKTAVLEE